MGSTNTQILPAVAAAVFDEKGRILLQKRRDVDQWCVFSGHVEFGESVEEAVLREIYEETETNAEIVRLIGVYSSPKSQTYRYDHSVVQYITTYFEVKLTGSIAENYSNEETKELRYFELDDLPKDLAQINPNWLQDALDKRYSGSIR